MNPFVTWLTAAAVFAFMEFVFSDGSIRDLVRAVWFQGGGMFTYWYFHARKEPA